MNFFQFSYVYIGVRIPIQFKAFTLHCFILQIITLLRSRIGRSPLSAAYDTIPSNAGCGSRRAAEHVQDISWEGVHTF